MSVYAKHTKRGTTIKFTGADANSFFKAVLASDNTTSQVKATQQEIETKGFECAVAGGDEKDCPYTKDSPDAELWLRGLAEGRAFDKKTHNSLKRKTP